MVLQKKKPSKNKKKPKTKQVKTESAPIKRPVGRPRSLSNTEAAVRQKESVAKRHKETSASIRDIGKLPIHQIDWDRRNACKHDLKLYCETYIKPVFYLGWSNDQLRCLRKIETVFLEGGMFSIAMPRGGGKTALCRSGTLWGTSYGYKKFPFLVGASGDKSTQTLEFIKTYWYMNPILRQDFPEIAYPIAKLQNRWHLAKGQTYNGYATHIEWGTEGVMYPCCLLSREEGETYLEHDPDSVQLVSVANDEGTTNEWYIAKTAGTIIRTSGIEGSIRGEAEVHPILLTQPRPDLIILDDVQKDSRADSPTQCDKLIRLIDGAVQGLAGPGETIGCLMPCTVSREGDVSDTYLDDTKKPEWQGERCRLVDAWPEGINDTDISLDTPSGSLWNQYNDLRRLSLRQQGNIKIATEFYEANRTVMDHGFLCSWPARYKKASEVSAQQHAMNLRFTNPATFPAEYQNRGRKLTNEGLVPITAEALAEKTLSLPRRMLPIDNQYLTAFIDVQNEGLFYTILGVNSEFTGLITDYGVFPNVNSRMFPRAMLDGWSLLSNEFFKAYPEQRATAIKTESGRLRAPLEAKIYHALTLCVRYLLSLNFVKDDAHQTQVRIQKIGIDARWGEITDVVKRFCREFGTRQKPIMPEGSMDGFLPPRDILVPYMGQFISPLHKQLEEYTRTPGWLFEDQKSPQVREVKWVYRTDASGEYYLSCDVNRMKSFLMARLSSPPGSSGCISLYDAPPDHHEMFARQICDSEYPETIIAKLRTKDLWQPREGNPDNDYFDGAVGCATLASFLGAYVRANLDGSTPTPRSERKLSQKWHEKRRNLLLQQQNQPGQYGMK